MIVPQIQKLAEVLVHYSTGVQAGEKVQIIGSPASEPLLREVYREVVRAGAHPIVRMRLTDQDGIYYAEAKEPRQTRTSNVFVVPEKRQHGQLTPRLDGV